MRSPDDDSRRNYPKDFSQIALNTPIPDKAGAPTGTSGVKAPFGRNQHDDIMDRAQSAGYLLPDAMKLIKQ